MPPILHRTGVYKILNTANGKFYVGSTAESFGRRWRNHRNFLRSGKHANVHLQRSWNRDGEKSFKFLVLEYCGREECVAREQHYLDLYQCWKDHIGYNRRAIAESNLGVKFSPSMREKISAVHKGKPKSKEHRESISRGLKGRKFSPEHLKKIGLSKKGKKLTEEHKRKIREGVRKSITPEYRKRMSEIKKGWVMSEETKKKISVIKKGKTHSPESRKKISDAKRGRPGTWIGRKHTEESKGKMRVSAVTREKKLKELETGSSVGLIRTDNLFGELT